MNAVLDQEFERKKKAIGFVVVQSESGIVIHHCWCKNVLRNTSISLTKESKMTLEGSANEIVVVFNKWSQ